MVNNAKRPFSIVLLMFVSLSVAYAGDVAQFINLGFSPDSRVFMFAQHGITEDESNPFAEIYTVDVPRNRFITDGVVSREYDVDISPGQDGSGALFSLLPEVRPVVDELSVDHLRQGRLIYLLVNGQEPRARIQFRDFETDDRFTIAMTQDARGNGAEGSAAFHLDVTAELADGTEVEARVGRPGYYRDGVNRYKIRQVVASPDEDALVIVVERITDTSSGQHIRYMVETLTLR
jgi:predicted secreted protein